MALSIPKVVYFEVGSECNLCCPFCFASPNGKGLETTATKNIIERFFGGGVRTLVFTGGEPFFRKDIQELVVYAHKEKLKTAIESNGLLVSSEEIARLEPYLDCLGLPLDAASPEVQYSLRGNTEIVANTLELLSYLKQTRILSKVNTIVTKVNREEVLSVGELLRDLNMGIWSVDMFVPKGRGQLHEDKFGITEQSYLNLVSQLKERYPFINIRAALRREKEGINLFVSPHGEAYVVRNNENVVLGDLVTHTLEEVLSLDSLNWAGHEKRFTPREIL